MENGDEFMGSNKRYGNIRKDVSDRIAGDVMYREKEKNFKVVDKYDSAIFEKGLNWGNSGLPLEDAPEEVKNNSNFINGFNKAKRLQFIAELEQSQTGPKR